MKQEIAKIESTFLGIEDHGIFTASLTVDYGGAGQTIGNYCLDVFDPVKKKRIGHAGGIDMITGIMSACGVSRWEKLVGRTIFVLTDDNGKVVGIGPLPTERGEPFSFVDWSEAQKERVSTA